MVTSWSARHGEAGAGGTGQGARPDRRMGPRLVRVAQGVWGWAAQADEAGRAQITRTGSSRRPHPMLPRATLASEIGAMDDTKSDDLILVNHELLAAAAKAWSDFMVGRENRSRETAGEDVACPSVRVADASRPRSRLERED